MLNIDVFTSDLLNLNTGILQSEKKKGEYNVPIGMELLESEKYMRLKTLFK